MSIYDIKGNLLTTQITVDYSTANSHIGEKCVCFGDSNMQFWAYNSRLKNMFSNLGMEHVNYGMSGAVWYSSSYDISGTDHHLSMGQINDFINSYGSDQEEFRVALILFGTNDSVNSIGNYEDTAGTESVVGYMRKFLDTLFTVGSLSTGVVIGIIPSHRYDSIETDSDLYTKINMIKRVYADYSIPVVDMYCDGNIRSDDLNSGDHVHYNGSEHGYDKLETMVSNAICTH